MSTTETPAAELREAAALLRERAEAATPGPWRPISALWRDDAFAAVLDDKGSVDDPRTWLVGSGLGAARPDATVAYIATMHPIVGAALADWLDATATDADEFIKQDTPDCGHEDDTLGCHCDRSPVWGCDRCGEYLAPGACRCWDKALAVARAMLGKEQQ